MAAGRPRKPTAQLITLGTFRKDRRPAGEPTPPRAKPEPPAHLTAAAKGAWKELVELTFAMGVLTSADVLALEVASGALADLRAARASLAKAITYSFVRQLPDTPDGWPQTEIVTKELSGPGERFYWHESSQGAVRRPRPELAAISDADRRLSVWLGRFGLSPSDRTKVSAEGGKAVGAFDEF